MRVRVPLLTPVIKERKEKMLRRQVFAQIIKRMMGKCFFDIEKEQAFVCKNETSEKEKR